MSLFRAPSPRQIDLGLAILRVVVGTVFVAHGGQKLFVYGLDGVAGSFGQMGIPAAGLFGPLTAFAEFFGGLALVAGLLTRLAAAGTTAVMAGAIAFVHAKAGFFLPAGSEFALTLLASSALLALTGAGRYSLDALIARRSDAGATDTAATPIRAARRAA
jgi:putative oxidoreductase